MMVRGVRLRGGGRIKCAAVPGGHRVRAVAREVEAGVESRVSNWGVGGVGFWTKA